MIDLERLTHDLASEVNLIDPDFLARWDRFKIEPEAVNCIRSEDYGLEQIGVVARRGDEVILFDDVEEEFGIGTVGKDGVLRDWTIYAGLDSCIKCFPGGEYYED